MVERWRVESCFWFFGFPEIYFQNIFKYIFLSLCEVKPTLHSPLFTISIITICHIIKNLTQNKKEWVAQNVHDVRLQRKEAVNVQELPVNIQICVINIQRVVRVWKWRNHAGQGLYATKLFKKGEKISDYRGVVKTSDEYNKKKSGYGIHLNKGSILDASSTQSGLGRYANNCRPSNKECKGNNAKIAVNNKNKTASLKATKSIRMGDEIYVPYGSGYWK